MTGFLSHDTVDPQTLDLAVMADEEAKRNAALDTLRADLHELAVYFEAEAERVQQVRAGSGSMTLVSQEMPVRMSRAGYAMGHIQNALVYINGKWEAAQRKRDNWGNALLSLKKAQEITRLLSAGRRGRKR